MELASAPESQHGSSLGRVLDVLGLFSAERSELSLSEIADLQGWPKPTAHRVTTTLVERSFLARDPATKRFRLGDGVIRLVAPLLRSFRLPELARGPLRTLAAETGETVNLAILDGAEALYLDSYPGTFRVRAQADSGLRVPVYCTAMGKCLLAQLGPEEAHRRVGSGPYPPMTQLTARRWSDLAPMLDAVRTDGFAVSVDEFEQGLLACAVAVHADRDTVAAINVAAPTARFCRETLIEILAPKLQTAAQAIHLAYAGEEIAGS
jgi:IclR family transcriptional regulator, acetate operon repressor